MIKQELEVEEKPMPANTRSTNSSGGSRSSSNAGASAGATSQNQNDAANSQGNSGERNNQSNARATSATNTQSNNSSSSTTGRDAGDRTELVLGGSIAPPEYGRKFSREASRKFYQAYEEYVRAIQIGNRGQTVQRYLLTVNELLPRYVRKSLAKLYQAGRDLSNDVLMEALGRHGGCWDDCAADPSKVAPEVARILTMGNEPEAMDRVDAVFGKLEEYFATGPAEKLFRDDQGCYRKGPASMITKALVDGVKPPELKRKVINMLSLSENWKDNPDVVFGVLRTAAHAWSTVEEADKARAYAKPRRHNNGNHGNAVKGGGKEGDSSQSKTSGKLCWGCDKPGHLRRDCPDPKRVSKPDQSGTNGTGGAVARPQSQPRNQSTGTSMRGNGATYGNATGTRAAVSGRAVVAENADGAANQGVELPPAPVFPTGTQEPTPETYKPAWRALVPVKGQGCSATGMHMIRGNDGPWLICLCLELRLRRYVPSRPSLTVGPGYPPFQGAFWSDCSDRFPVWR